MVRPTDKNFSLKSIVALEGRGVLGTGTTQPLLVRGVCPDTGERGDYVVKFWKAPRMSVEACARELVASLIGLELDLHLPEPVIVQIRSEFVDSLVGFDGYKSASNSLGSNFGTAFVPGFTEVLPRYSLDGLTVQAQRVFAFDLLVSNSDRRIDKPNVGMTSDGLMIIDHELAFGFVFTIVKNPRPWIILPQDLEWIKKHIFLSGLRGTSADFSEYAVALERLNSAFWTKVFTLIPVEWQSVQLNEIQETISSIVAHREAFCKQLKELLS